MRPSTEPPDGRRAAGAAALHGTPAHGRSPVTVTRTKLILASSLGTVFEWYDFYLYGALATIIAQRFFGGVESGSAFALALLAFAAGFVVRPVGALLFGRLGDLIGRRHTFVITVMLMGLSTFMVGLVPSHESIGGAAPVLLVGLRLLQGLALGGEYGGAAIYVAEMAPRERRGLYTAWIQTTATLGLLLSLLVVLGTRAWLGTADFEAWGWRLPFLLSVLLLGLSGWMRWRMIESPAFQRLLDSGQASSGPIRDSFARWRNLRLVLLALFGLVAGQAVVWYTGQFYALFYLQEVLRVDADTAGVLVAAALLLTAPCFVVFGALSDHIGRKPVIGAGLLLACLGFFPVFKALTLAANPALAQAQATVVVVVRADPATCHFQGNPVARDDDFDSGCDIARRALAQSAVQFTQQALAPGAGAAVQIGSRTLNPPALTRLPGTARLDNASTQALRDFRADLHDALVAAGYPTRAPVITFGSASWWVLLALLSALGVLVAMVYGPTVATLTELFPTRIRYTSLSLPYHLGNGWFGGLVPTIAFAIVAGRGDPLQGLWYPVLVAAATFVIGLLWLPETRGRDIHTLR